MTDIITFGKHKGETYQELLHSDPQYCRWLMNTEIKPGSPSADLIEWLYAQDIPIPSFSEKTKMNVGKLKGKKIKDILNHYPNYCDWVRDNIELKHDEPMNPLEYLKTIVAND